MRVALAVFTVSLLTLAQADTIDNEIIGEPKVECGTDSLTVQFETLNVFEGHAYVKEHFGKNGCRSFPTLTNGVNLTVSYADCTVQKQRQGNGIQINSIIIISFHPMFETKVDRSFNVECFYTEVKSNMVEGLQLEVNNKAAQTIKGVGNQSLSEEHINENDLTPKIITGPLPLCTYDVLSENKEGAPIKVTSVGQPVYHRWSCEAKGEEKFCATVHSCTVREEGGRIFQLLDENGCALDKYLLNNLEYTSDLVGGQISEVFKFADQPSLFFQCQIRLSLKEGDKCIRSSDTCPTPLRGKRSAEVDSDVDVFSQRMKVFDIDDDLVSDNLHEMQAACPDKQSLGTYVSPQAIFVYVVLLIVLLLLSCISLGMLACRVCSRTHVAKLNEFES